MGHGWSDLHKVYLEAMSVGSLGEIINKGNIKLIPNLGDPELIAN